MADWHAAACTHAMVVRNQYRGSDAATRSVRR